MSRPRPLHVVIVGQTPPPYGGQAVMVQELIQSKFAHVQLSHVRMAFSAEMSDIGRLQARKLLHLLRVLAAVGWIGLTRRPDVLYYTPCGPDPVPVVRDVLILLLTRRLYRHLILHFFAGGLSELLPQLPRPLRWLASSAYGRPDIGIKLGAHSPPDPERLEARKVVVVPNGVPDLDRPPSPVRDFTGAPVELLFAAVLRESKGIFTFIEACGRLKKTNVPFMCTIMGQFYDHECEVRVRSAIHALGIEDCVQFTGVLTGRSFEDAYRRTDIFCFPSHFESESSPVVVIEAMKHGRPVIASAWRGIPDLVIDGVTGLLVPPRDAEALACAVSQLASSPTTAQAMGRRGRRRYEEHHSLNAFRSGLQALFDTLPS